MGQHDDIPVREIAARETTKFFQSLPLNDRRRLKPRSTCQRQAEQALLKVSSARASTRSDPPAFVRNFLGDKAFVELFEPYNPTGSLWVLREAERIARGILIEEDRIFRAQYGSAIADLDAAKSIGALGLFELGKAMRREKAATSRSAGIRNPKAYLRVIIMGHVLEMVDASMKFVAPGARARYHRTRRLAKALEQTHPRLSSVERRELAGRRADGEAARLGRLLRQSSEEDALEAVVDPVADTLAGVLDSDYVETVDLLVSRPPFTETDEDTWRLLKSVDYVRREIDWPLLRGIGNHAGCQRVAQLLGKLAEVMENPGV